MARAAPLLTDRQWQRIEPLLPAPPPATRRGGRPRVPDRAVLAGILWVLKTGARWRDLPTEYPSPTTCWRRLRDWEEAGVWEEVWHTFLDELDRRGVVAWEEVFADATFVPAKKGATRSGKPGAARARSSWWWSMARGFLWHLGSRLQRRPR